MRVAVGGEHLEHAVLDLQDRDVERTAAKVVHRDDAAVAPVEPVRQRCGRRLVDDAKDFEAGESPGVARRGALRVVEVRRHGDDGAIHLEIELALFPEMVFGALPQLAKDERGDLRRGELAVVETDAHDPAGLASDPERQQRRLATDVVDAAAHESLDGVHAPRRRRQQATLRFAAHEERPILTKRHDRRHERIARRVTDDVRHTVAHVCDKTVRRPEVDSYDFTHVFGLQSPVFVAEAKASALRFRRVFVGL